MSEELQEPVDTPVPPTLTLINKLTGHGGRVDAEAEHPDGAVLVRINDQWFFLDDCEEWQPR